MSPIHMKTMMRAAALVAMTAAPAFASFAPPQTGQVSASAAPRARTARCIGCDDSTRSVLILKLDSLRTQFTTRRLSPSEQDAVAREMDATLAALRELIESSGRPGSANATTIVRSGGAAAGASSGQGTSYTIVIQKRGYIGLSLDGPSYGYPPERPEVIRYIQYPKIASIDPSSPAELSGLKMGDTLIAMNGADVVETEIPLGKWLVPDEKMTLKVRRDGDAKEFRVVVAAAPPYVERRLTPFPDQGGAIARVPMPPGRGRVDIREQGPGQAAPVPPSPTVFMFGSTIYGARLETMSEGLSKALGVKQGVLVIQSIAGSPAFVSGLRDGDVIISASGTSVATVRDLLTIVRTRDGDEGVKLVVLRDKKQQDVTLRQRQ